MKLNKEEVKKKVGDILGELSIVHIAFMNNDEFGILEDIRKAYSIMEEIERGLKDIEEYDR